MKLMFCCHAASTEIGGFGISAADDPLTIEDFVLLPQLATPVSVEFDDGAVADHADRYVDLGVEPKRSMRVWIHTHPGDSASPSGIDEATFARSFGGCDWAAMLILSRGEETYCRIRFSAGPGGQIVVPVVFDWEQLPAWLTLSPHDLHDLIRGWQVELDTRVVVEPLSRSWHLLDDDIRHSTRARPEEPDASIDDLDCFELDDRAARWLAQHEQEVARGER